MSKLGVFSLPRLMRPLAVRVQSLSKRNTSHSRYTCLALTGQSDYNICINADLTVSCHCADFDGTGHIGDLNEQSFKDIFKGPKISSFLELLNEGTLPIEACASCFCLQPLKKDDRALRGKVPTKGLMIENTAHCNYRCAFCDRKTLLETRARTTISLEDLEKVVKDLSNNPPEVISYLNLGEPFLSKDILKEVQILKKYLPQSHISTSTNGALLKGLDKIGAALLMDNVSFSIDGINQETLAQYQERGDFDAAYSNMKALVSARAEMREKVGKPGPYIEWKYVLFKWNDSAQFIETAIRLAEEAGIDSLTFIPGTTSTENISYQYFTDKTLEKRTEHTDTGRTIRFTPAPIWL